MFSRHLDRTIQEFDDDTDRGRIAVAPCKIVACGLHLVYAFVEA